MDPGLARGPGHASGGGVGALAANGGGGGSGGGVGALAAISGGGGGDVTSRLHAEENRGESAA